MGWRILVFYPEPESKLLHVGVNFPEYLESLNILCIKFKILYNNVIWKNTTASFLSKGRFWTRNS